MIDFMLLALSIVFIVEMTLRKIWKKSISTYFLILGFSFYFICKAYGFYELGSIVLAVLMMLAYHRALFKKEGDIIKTWGV